MGKASRRKREEKERLSPEARKVLHQMIKEAKAEKFAIENKINTDVDVEANTDPRIQYFNPLKRILEGNGYKSQDGYEVTKSVMEQYGKFLNSKLNKKKEE